MGQNPNLVSNYSQSRCHFIILPSPKITLASLRKQNRDQPLPYKIILAFMASAKKGGYQESPKCLRLLAQIDTAYFSLEFFYSYVATLFFLLMFSPLSLEVKAFTTLIKLRQRPIELLPAEWGHQLWQSEYSSRQSI